MNRAVCLGLALNNPFSDPHLSRNMVRFNGVRWAPLVVAGAAYLPWATLASDNLRVQISVGNNILKGDIDGRVVLIFAPNGTDPLEDTDVTSTPNKMFGKNVFQFGASDTVTLSGGGPNNTATGVSGFPLVSIGKKFLETLTLSTLGLKGLGLVIISSYTCIFVDPRC